MVEPDYIELIHYKIDGVITTEDRDRLDKHMKENSEARALYDELRGVAETLTKVQTVEPPAALKRSILNSLPKNLYAQESAPSRSTGWLDFLQRKPKRGLSISFAVGLACGLVLFTLLVGLPDMNNSDLMGTIRTSDSAQDLRLLTSIEIVEDEFSMAFKLERSEQSVVVTMNPHSQVELEFALEFDQNDLQFSGFQTTDPIGAEITVDPGRVSLRHQGLGRIIMQFMDKTSAASQIFLRVYNRQLIYENSFDTAPE